MKVVTRLVLVALAAACSGATSETTSAPAAPSFPVLGEAVEIPPLPDLDAASIALGQLLYGQHCAGCHLPDLTGAPDWRQPNGDGSYPPPPHDSSGHTWHHADQLLVEIVLDGMDFPQSRMPAFRGVLTEGEVLAILDYFKSSWGPMERSVQWEATQRAAAQAEVG